VARDPGRRGVIELELKAVVPDPAALRRRLREAGAAAGFAGFMHDRRLDRDGELLARGEVLRVRRSVTPGGDRVEVAWKGPVAEDRGYKRREELALAVAGGDAAEDLLAALGYAAVEAIDRYVEYYDVGGATVRLEWYPRMDVLVEVEGAPAAIERAVAATGLPRRAFTAEPLAAFVARWEARAGHPAATSAAALGAEAPAWAPR
jgi:adenylate cyclase class IV